MSLDGAQQSMGSREAKVFVVVDVYDVF